MSPFPKCSYAAKIKKSDWYDPLLLQCLPRREEDQTREGYKHDPVGDSNATVLPGLIHKYKNRVLLTLSSECSIHCRYCFRKNYSYHTFSRSDKEWNSIWNYIKSHKEITEVILSGGDPLTVSNNFLKEIFNSIEVISQVKTVRIHSRIPSVSPQRVNLNFRQLLTEFQQTGLTLVMVHHINHPNEIGFDNKLAFENIQKTGVLQLNQSVLLKNVNDNAKTLIKLSEKLLSCGILPYYLHQLDQVEGSHHFYVDPKKGKDILKEMTEELQGYGVPKYVVEEPGKSSKTTIV